MEQPVLHSLVKEPDTAGVNDNHVYHALASHRLLSILKSDSLRLPLSETNSSEAVLGTKKLFYLSTARTPTSGYIADRSQGLRSINEACLIVFDKRKLERYRGVTFAPVQYYSVDEHGRSMGSSQEAEDRLFSDKPTLQNISKSIVEVRLVVFPKPYPVDSYLRSVLSILKKKKIPVKLFTSNNKVGFLTGREQKEDRKAAYNVIKNAPQPNKNTSTRDAMYSTIVRKRLGWTNKHWLVMLSEYVYKNTLDDLSKDARNNLYYVLKAYNSNTFGSYYAAEIHNLRSGLYKNEQDKLNRMLAYTKSETLKDFFNKLQIKWSALYV